MTGTATAVPILAEVADALERWPGVLVLLPADGPQNELQYAIEHHTVARFGAEGIMPLDAAEAVALTPGELVARCLDRQDPIEVPQDLRDFNAPIVVIVTGDDCNPDQAQRWLRAWSEHFRRFKVEFDRGRGLRVIWMGSLTPRLFRRTFAPPEHWTTITWREPEPADLQRIMQDELRGCLSLLTPLQQEFLTARLTDLAGGRKADLELALKLVHDVRGGRSPGEWLDRVAWNHAPVPDRVSTALRQVADVPAVERLLSLGGVVARFVQQDWERRWPGWEEALWAYGLWSTYGADLVGLSPLALHVAQRDRLLSGRPAAPPSETTLRLLGRCLYWERLLKDRLVLRLSHPRWGGRIQQALLELDDEIDAPEALVQSSTLGHFLRLLAQVLPGGPNKWNFTDLSRVRNQAAHGHPITWANHWAKLEAIEPLLVQAYAALAE